LVHGRWKATRAPQSPGRAQVIAWLRDPCISHWSRSGCFSWRPRSACRSDRKGDGSEYILATESLLYDRDLTIDNKVDIFRHLMQRPQRMDSPAGPHAHRVPDGRERYGLHSFYYRWSRCRSTRCSVTGFYLLNALCRRRDGDRGVPARRRAAHRSRSRSRFAALSIFLSATWSYVFWTQPKRSTRRY
jgi:hypothetical protein